MVPPLKSWGVITVTFFILNRTCPSPHCSSPPLPPLPGPRGSGQSDQGSPQTWAGLLLACAWGLRWPSDVRVQRDGRANSPCRSVCDQGGPRGVNLPMELKCALRAEVRRWWAPVGSAGAAGPAHPGAHLPAGLLGDGGVSCY